MQKLKKVLSVLLSIMLILSVLAVAPIEVSAVESYEIMVGTTLVTSANCGNILGNSTASYDPVKKELKLNNPTLLKGYEDNAMIIINVPDVTVTGEYHMTTAAAKNGLAAAATVTLDGDFTFMGKNNGVAANTGVTVSGGSLKAVATLAADAAGVYVPDGTFAIESGVTRVEASGVDAAVVADGMTMDKMRITSPESAFFDAGARTVLLPDLSGVASTIVVTPFTGTEYNLWLGVRRVTSENCGDIFGDGKAQFDPDTNTLTLNNPTISGSYNFVANKNTFKIYSRDMDLTIRGSYKMSKAECFGGVHSTKNLTFEGDFTLYGDEFGAEAHQDLHINSGTLIAVGTETGGVVCESGNIYIDNGINMLDATGGIYPLYATEIVFGDKLILSVPKNGGLGVETSANKQFICDENLEVAKHVVVLSPDATVSYDLTVGGVEVTNKNCRDILSDGGKAWYDPDTRTLTLNSPNIKGSNNDSVIYAKNDLTVRGTYQGTASAKYGIYCEKNLTLNGILTFKGTDTGIYADAVTFASGTLSASGGELAGVDADKISFEDGIKQVTLESGKYAARALHGITLGSGVKVAEPSGAMIGSPALALGYTTIYTGFNVLNQTIAKNATITGAGAEPQPTTIPQPTTEPVTTAPQPTTEPVTTVPQPTTEPVTTVPQPTTEPVTTEPAEPTLHLDGAGTMELPYLIQTTADWNDLQTYIAKGGATSGICFQQTKAVSVTTTLGTDANPFAGTYDGDGNTLTLSLSSKEQYNAPFSRIGGATIKNLKTDGSVSGNKHCSGLVGRLVGGNNLIEGCVVSASVKATSGGYCGGIVGHGYVYDATLKNCVFNGSIAETTYIGTIWGWCDDAGTPTLINCLDLSATDYQIGLGGVNNVTVTNCYYTNPEKKTDHGRKTWSDSGKRAFTVTGDGVTLTLNGDVGVAWEDTLYAAEDETVSLIADKTNVLYTASAGSLSQNGSALTLTMPAENVVIKPSDAAELNGYTLVSGADGSENLLDGSDATEWCVTDAKLPISVTFKTGKPVIPAGYRLTAAGDPACAPVSWTLEGSADGESWTTLTETADNKTLCGQKNQPCAFSLTDPTAAYCSFFRFTVNGVADGGTLRLAGLQLLGAEKVYKEYDLWLGSTQVTSENMDDILHDGGKAQFDPVTNTLTLDDPVIEGEYKSARIFCKGFWLTVKGSYHMTEPVTKSLAYAIYAWSGGLTLDGDFTLQSTTYGIQADWGLTVASGNLDVFANIHALYIGGTLEFKNGVKRAELRNNPNGIRCAIECGSVTIGDELEMLEPSDGVWNDGTKRVVIEHVPTYYDLWLGETQVSSRNRDDILSDGGKAQFDPDTNTLTLDNPSINGTHESAKIYADGIDLTVKGAYKMRTDDDCAVAIRADSCGLTLDGDFTLTATDRVIFADQHLTVDGGTLRVSGASGGIYVLGDLTLNDSVVRVDAESTGDAAITCKGTVTVSDRLRVTDPIDAEWNGVCEHVVIQSAPVPGDVNLDGSITIDDVTTVQKAVAELVSLNKYQLAVADVTGDGKITIDDATMIQKYIAELIDHLG